MKIDIYIGHGGTDPGAVKGNLVEHLMAAVSAKGCYDSLVSNGIEVRIEKGNLSINQAVAAANKWGADILLDFHYNAGGGNRGEVIHSLKDKSGFANIIAKGLKNAGQSVVTVRPYPNPKNPKVDYLGIIRGFKGRAYTVEVCFLDSADVNDFDTTKKQYNAGVQIAHAIMEE